MGKQKLAGAEDQPKQEIPMERGGNRRPTAATFSKRTRVELARKTAVYPTGFHYHPLGQILPPNMTRKKTVHIIVLDEY